VMVDPFNEISLVAPGRVAHAKSGNS